jgi:hypothetical protein
MPFVTTPLVRYHPHEPCVCVGPCAGYDTRSNCPPLIVLAVLAQSEPVIQLRSLQSERGEFNSSETQFRPH